MDMTRHFASCVCHVDVHPMLFSLQFDDQKWILVANFTTTEIFWSLILWVTKNIWLPTLLQLKIFNHQSYDD